MNSARLASGPGRAAITGPTNSGSLLAERSLDSETFFLFRDFRRLLHESWPPPMHAARHDGGLNVRRL